MQAIFDKILRLVEKQFPRFHVEIEAVPDSPDTRAIAVYGVDATDVKIVKAFINDQDWNLCQPTGCAVIPRVVSYGTTKQYYPQFLPQRAFQDNIFDQLFRWTLLPPPYNRCPSPLCANEGINNAGNTTEELALAA